MKAFVTRLITGAILLAAVLAVIFGPRWAVLLMVLYISCIGIGELLHVMILLNKKPEIPIVIGANLCLQAAAFVQSTSAMLAVIALYLMAATVVLTFNPKKQSDGIFSSFYAFIYVGGLSSFLLLFPKERQAYLLLPLIASWGTDTFAYCFGMLFGKHKLCPTISPKKSVEGAIGGVIGAMLIMLPFRWFFFTDVPLWLSFLIVFVGSIASQLGDLCASHFKRESGIKDYGNLLAGHGGVMDRFDSVLFAAPVSWFLLQLMM